MKRLKKFQLLKDDSEGELPDGDYVVSILNEGSELLNRRKLGSDMHKIRSDNSTGKSQNALGSPHYKFHHRIEGGRLVPPTPKPRVWQRIEDVPEGVVVKDKSSARYSHRDGRLYYHGMTGDRVQPSNYEMRMASDLAPFTATGYRVEIEFEECDD